MDLVLTEDGALLGGEWILDCRDTIHNYSRVPLQRVDSGSPETVMELLMRIRASFSVMYENTDQYEFAEYYTAINTLMANYFIHHVQGQQPLQAVELGCNRGGLSSRIAPLLAAFDLHADYVCVCDVIGNESGNGWLDGISQVRTPTGLSLLAADYFNTHLRDKAFDYTVINGTVPISEPMAVIREAERITAPGGELLLYAHQQCLLADTFLLLYPQCRIWGTEEDRILKIVFPE